MLVDSLIGPSATRADATQGQLSAIYLTGPMPLSDQTTFIAEVAYLHVNDVDAFEFAGMSSDELTYDRNSWAYQLLMTPSWTVMGCQRASQRVAGRKPRESGWRWRSTARTASRAASSKLPRMRRTASSSK